MNAFIPRHLSNLFLDFFELIPKVLPHFLQDKYYCFADLMYTDTFKSSKLKCLKISYHFKYADIFVVFSAKNVQFGLGCAILSLAVEMLD